MRAEGFPGTAPAMAEAAAGHRVQGRAPNLGQPEQGSGHSSGGWSVCCPLRVWLYAPTLEASMQGAGPSACARVTHAASSEEDGVKV